MTYARMGDMAIGGSIIPLPPFFIPGVGVVLTPNSVMNIIEGLPSAGLGSVILFPLGVAITLGTRIGSIRMGTPSAGMGDVGIGQSFGIIIPFSVMTMGL
jgi:hypothetical protein